MDNSAYDMFLENIINGQYKIIPHYVATLIRKHEGDVVTIAHDISEVIGGICNDTIVKCNDPTSNKPIDAADLIAVIRTIKDANSAVNELIKNVSESELQIALPKPQKK